MLTLKTREDAFLSSEDKITDVLSNNEEVIASVESWDLPALSERYRTACISANTSKQALLLLAAAGAIVQFNGILSVSYALCRELVIFTVGWCLHTFNVLG